VSSPLCFLFFSNGISAGTRLPTAPALARIFQVRDRSRQAPHADRNAWPSTTSWHWASTDHQWILTHGWFKFAGWVRGE
jgi:hypothetical protein